MSRQLACLSMTFAWLGWPGAAWADDARDCRFGTPTQRIEVCTRILEKPSKNSRQTAITYNNRGWGHNDKGNYDKAIQDLNEALRLGPNNPTALANRAYSHYRRNDYGLARSDLDASIAIKPENASAFTLRGRIAEALRQRERALADLSEAIRIDPAYLDAYGSRASVYTAKGDREKAVADYRKALELPASTPRGRMHHETAKARIERYEKINSAGARAASRRVALVIGNSAYANVAPLANPKNDAKAIAEMLRRLGFTEVTEHYDLGQAAMSEALKVFGDAAADADWAVVFFAGHGMEVGGTNYLIPVDAKLLRDSHVPEETISLDRVQAKVDGAVKLGLVILDACRNNPFAARIARSGGTTRSLGRGLGVIEPDGNVMVAFAAKHGTVAEDGAGRNSPFTESLLQRAEAPNLDVGILFRKVRDDVRAKTQGRQDPYIYGSLGGDLLFLKTAAGR